MPRTRASTAKERAGLAAAQHPDAQAANVAVTLSVLPPEAELLELIFLHLSADEISSMRTLG